MTKNNIVETDLNALLEAASGDYVVAYHELVAAEDRKALVRQANGTNAETRKAAWRKALAVKDTKVLQKIRGAFRRYMLEADAVAEIATAEAHALDEVEAKAIMEQVLDGKSAKEFIEATYEQAKRLVFASLDIQFAETGEEFPEQTNGWIDVPELGKRFCREGAGRKDPELDEDKLRALVGEEVWEQITVEEVIPAQTVRKLDLDLLMGKAKTRTSLLEDLRASLKVGDWKNPRLMVRDIPADEEE